MPEISWKRMAAFGLASILATSTAFASVECVQTGLSGLGYNPGPSDGMMGRRTENAAAQFALDTGTALPTLDESNSPQWCEAIDTYAQSPEAAILSTPVAGLLPNDVLIDFASVSPTERQFQCPVSSNITQLANYQPVTKIEGFTSRMGGDVDRVPGARDAEDYAATFSGLAAKAFAADDAGMKAELLDSLHHWAKSRAFLDTISCVTSDGFLDNSSRCSEWTVPDGSDLSGMKDATFATFLAAGMIRAYFITLSDFEPETRAGQHAEIRAWIDAISERLKRPDDVYFGLNMGWYWPGIVDDVISGDATTAQQKLERLVSGIDRLIHADGSIEDRTTRGDRAIWYHYTSLGEIVVSLELIRAGGVQIPERLVERLHKAVDLFLNAVDDPATIEPWARQVHNARYEGTQDWEFQYWPNSNFGGSWLHIYPYRYPDRPEAQRLRALVSLNAGSASSDVDFGLGLGCIYNAAGMARTSGGWVYPGPAPASEATSQ